ASAFTAGAVVLHGGAGNDTLIGGNGSSSLFGLSNQLEGGDGNDSITGSDSEDLIFDGSGNDIVNGRGGDDIFVNRNGGGTVSDRDTINGGNGEDEFQGDVRDSLLNVEQNYDPDSSAPPAPTPASPPAGASAAVNNGILVVNGTSASDQITLTQTRTAINVSINGVSAGSFPLSSITRDVEISGGAGNDAMTFSGADSTIRTRTCFFNGNAGNDTLTGGSGNDVFICNASRDGNDVMTGNGGNDKADYSRRTVGCALAIDGVANDGEFAAGDRDNIKPGIEVIFAGSGADTIKGSSGDDLLAGGRGAD